MRATSCNSKVLKAFRSLTFSYGHNQSHNNQYPEHRDCNIAKRAKLPTSRLVMGLWPKLTTCWRRVVRYRLLAQLSNNQFTFKTWNRYKVRGAAWYVTKRSLGKPVDFYASSVDGPLFRSSSDHFKKTGSFYKKMFTKTYRWTETRAWMYAEVPQNQPGTPCWRRH